MDKYRTELMHVTVYYLFIYNFGIAINNRYIKKSKEKYLWQLSLSKKPYFLHYTWLKKV